MNSQLEKFLTICLNINSNTQYIQNSVIASEYITLQQLINQFVNQYFGQYSQNLNLNDCLIKFQSSKNYYDIKQTLRDIMNNIQEDFILIEVYPIIIHCEYENEKKTLRYFSNSTLQDVINEIKQLLQKPQEQLALYYCEKLVNQNQKNLNQTLVKDIFFNNCLINIKVGITLIFTLNLEQEKIEEQITLNQNEQFLKVIEELKLRIKRKKNLNNSQITIYFNNVQNDNYTLKELNLNSYTELIGQVIIIPQQQVLY